MSRFSVYTAAAAALLLLAAYSGGHLAGQDVRGDAEQTFGRTALNDLDRDNGRVGAGRFDRSGQDRFASDERYGDEDFGDEDFDDAGFDDGFEDEGRFGDEDEFDDELSDDLDGGDFDDEGFDDEDDFDEDDGRFEDEDGFDDEDMDDEEFDDRPRRGLGRRGFDDEDEIEIDLDYGPMDDITEEQIEVAGWIGAEVGPLDPAVAAHVSLEDGQGLMVYEVLPESPAANAGLQEFDILITVAGTALTDFAQLRDHVSQAKGSEVSVDILRKGKKQTVPLKPGEQPWIPDVFMPGNVDLPDNVEVTISKKGGGPVTVTIRQGDQTWTASSEEEFEELPEQSVMWLFATMSEFMPFEDEEEFDEDWGGPGEFEYERFSARGIPMEEDEEFGEDPYERRLNDLEGKIDRILKQLEAK